MPTITFDQISKSYGSTEVIHEFSAEIPDNEFLVLLGPSGCGKSTMLRMIAGLVDITSGNVRFDGRSVERLDPRARGVAFVFQSYALYPHMTVRQNIAFPLLMNEFKWWHHIPGINTVQRRRVLRRPDVVERIERIATTLQLHDYLDRKPKALSGGQRQRVAVARALVREPSLYLLDEPLSNLDAKLRTQMRAEITNLFNTVQKTFVYVTHDQVEAMTMGTRIVVMDKGRIQQIGTPEEIYEQPVNTFVAQFIGSPPMNLMEVTLDAGVARFADGSTIALPGAEFPEDRSGTATFGVRAEKVRLVPEWAPTSVRARIVTVERHGAETVVGFSLVEGDSSAPLIAPSTLYFARVAGNPPIMRGSHCFAALDLDGAALFDDETGERVPAPAVTAAQRSGTAP